MPQRPEDYQSTKNVGGNRRGGTDAKTNDPFGYVKLKPEHGYLGHFRQDRFVREGHNVTRPPVLPGPKVLPPVLPGPKVLPPVLPGPKTLPPVFPAPPKMPTPRLTGARRPRVTRERGGFRTPSRRGY